MNDKVKEAIISFLEKRDLINENTYNELLSDSEKLKTIREVINNSLLNCKRKITFF